MTEIVIITLILLLLFVLGAFAYVKIRDITLDAKDSTSKLVIRLTDETNSLLGTSIERNDELAEGTLIAIEALEKSLKGQLDSVKIADRASKLAEENAILREKQQEYRRFFAIMLETVREDTVFMRSSLFKRLGSVDEYQEINHQIQAFQNRLDGIETTLREYKMIEMYEDE